MERLWALSAFSEGKSRVLIATDVSARGLDIPDINYVVNYDMPTEPEVYVHRIGRTGRGNKHGVAVSFCAPEEEALRKAIEALIGRYLPVIEMDRVAHDETIELSAAANTDWRTLLKREQEREIEQLALAKKKKRKR